MTRLTIESIISFYDNKDTHDSKDASSITGLVGEELAAGLIKHYLEGKNMNVEILAEKPTEGKKKGKWLDKWIKAQDGSNCTYYQTEIKNWCSHSLSGQAISLNSTDEELKKYAHNRFFEQWDNKHQKFNDAKVGKVLNVMRTPESLNQSTGKIRPLICYWYPILNKSIDVLTPFFALDCSGIFEQVDFFSMSIYMRQLLKEGHHTIELDMKQYEGRIRRLNEMYCITNNGL
jgi:hypothetical protein